MSVQRHLPQSESEVPANPRGSPNELCRQQTPHQDDEDGVLYRHHFCRLLDPRVTGSVLLRH